MARASCRTLALACATAAGLATGRRRVRAEAARTYSDGGPRGKPRMIIADPDRFAVKWRRFCADGLDRLLVISDFDQTLTPQFLPSGEQATSTHGLLMSSVLLDPAMQKRERELFQQYYPIEVSPTLTREQKLPYMIDWWNKAHELLVDCKMQRAQLDKAITMGNLPFRDGFPTFFALLEQHRVPTLIFSAGLYQVIHGLLDKEFHAQGRTKTPANIHVVSNMMIFDERGQLQGFKGNLIHCYNKNAGAMLDTPFWRQCQLEKRRNVLLLGDSRGDADMAHGLALDDDAIIRVGFLNLHVDQALDEYLALYDVVLTHDASLHALEVLLPPPTTQS